MCIWKFKFASRIMWILQYLRDIYLPGVFVLWKITIFLQLKICVNYFSLKFDAMTIQFYDFLFIFCLNISFFLVISYLCLHLMKRARLLLRKRHTVPSPSPLFWNSVIVRSIIQVVSRVKDHHMSQVIYANILLGLTSEGCLCVPKALAACNWGEMKLKVRCRIQS